MRRLLLTLLPKWLLSRSVRCLAAIPLPPPLRSTAYRLFAHLSGADLRDMRGELRDYRSVAAFFCRPLRSGARPIDPSAQLVWPCDGTVSSAGKIEHGVIEQVKGQDYSVARLLGNDAELAARFEGGTQATIYLAPRDYHRVHAPLRGRLARVRPLPGGLFPVNPQTARVIPELFASNERCVFEFAIKPDQIAVLVMIAALNVSDIRPSVEVGVNLECGQELGAFGLGSTVVVLLPPGALAFAEQAAARTVRMGERIL